MIEIDGQLRFGLPGTPLFPGLPPGTDLRPTLEWQVRTTAPVKGQAEVSYLCDGMRWEAAYTVVAKDGDETSVDVNGVITVENQTGTDFRAARFKCVAGDVMKLRDDGNGGMSYGRELRQSYAGDRPVEFAGLVTRAAGKGFSDYHLYTMPDRIDLRDRETKQLGFLDARGVSSRKRLIYDGLDIDWNKYSSWNQEHFRTQREFGTGYNPKVSIERQIENSEANHLGKPMPAGILRCYLIDDDGKPEFIGENRIDHTPVGETLRFSTGNAFDVVGERVQSDFACDANRRVCDESYRIIVRNQGSKPVEVTVVEHLYRWSNWEIRLPSTPFTKRDSRTIEFPVTVPAQGETAVSYQAHYSW